MNLKNNDEKMGSDMFEKTGSGMFEKSVSLHYLASHRTRVPLNSFMMSIFLYFGEQVQCRCRNVENGSLLLHNRVYKCIVLNIDERR